MRIRKTQRHSSSAADKISLTCPRSWKEMTQEQLRFTFRLMGEQLTSVELRTMLLIRFTGITVERRWARGWQCTLDGRSFYLKTWQVQSMIKQLEYVDSYEELGVRLESVQGFQAVNILLHQVPFKNYLMMEKYYQMYLKDRKAEYLVKLARLLYPGDIKAMDTAEQVGVTLWYGYVKRTFSKLWPHFFKPTGGQTVKPMDFIEQMNAQIRALTDGDITKEEIVLATDTWRALTELDAKAHDIQEIKRNSPKTS